MTIRCRTKCLVSGHAPRRGQATRRRIRRRAGIFLAICRHFSFT